MDVSALSLNVDSSSLVKAANDLDRFSKSSERAAASASKVNFGGFSGSIAKMVALVQSIDNKLSSLIGTLEKVASAERVAAVANDNMASSAAKAGAALAAADAHVSAYQSHLTALTSAATTASTAQQALASTATRAAASSELVFTGTKAEAAALEAAARAAWEKEMAIKAAGLADQRAANLAWNAAKAQQAQATATLQAAAASKAAQTGTIGVATATQQANAHVVAYQKNLDAANKAQNAARAGAGLLAGVFGGVLGIAISAGISLLIEFISKLLDAESGLDKVRFAADELGNAQKILGSVMDLTTGKINTQNSALIALARAQLIAANAQAKSRQAEARSEMQGTGQMGWVESSLRGALDPNGYWARKKIGDSISGIMRAVEAGADPDKAIRTLEQFNKAGALSDTAFTKAAAAVANFAGEANNIKSLEAAQATLNGVATAAQKAMVLQSPKAMSGLTDAIERQVALETATTATAKAQAHLNDVRAQAAAIDKMEAGAAKDAALLKYKTDLTSATIAYTNAQKADSDARKAATASTRAHNKELRESARLAREAAKEFEKLTKWIGDTRMQAQGNVWKLAQEIEKSQQDWGNDLKTWGEENKEAFDAAARVREGQLDTEYRLLDIYLDQLDAIRQMGGAFDTIGGVIQGIATGNFRGVGGKLGGLLGTIGSVDSGVWAESKFGAAGNELEQAERIGTTISAHMEKLFRENGKFFQGLKSVLANAAIGSTAANLTGGSKLGGMLGGALGGAFGGKLGEKLLADPLKKGLSKTLGSFAGPLGSALGGILGGALGGVLKKTKWGAVELSSSGVSASRGNNSAAEKAAVSVGDNIMSSLNQIAEAFGGSVGSFGNITIGQRHGDWRVNTTGTSLKVKKGGKDFNDDAEGAIAYAIQIAIQRGAINGIRASTQKLLQASGDLQTKLSKALQFQGVFDELEQRLNPTGYALEKLTKEFESLRKIFDEAGATAEEYAKLEQLMALKRQDAMEEASSALRDFLKSMNMGSSSPLSLRDQAMNAQKALDPYLAAIKAGQAIDQNKYLEAAQTYLDIQRQMYGSTAKYFDAFNMIQDATNKAIATADNVAPIRTEADPYIQDTANSTRAMQADTANAVTLLEKIRALLEERAANDQSGFIGTTRNYA